VAACASELAGTSAALTVVPSGTGNLLATNLGGRLGFLVAFASLSGFLMLLGLIWFTNLTPLNALHGPAPHWVVKEAIDNPAQAKTETVRTIDKDGVIIAGERIASATVIWTAYLCMGASLPRISAATTMSWAKFLGTPPPIMKRPVSLDFILSWVSSK